MLLSFDRSFSSITAPPSFQFQSAICHASMSTGDDEKSRKSSPSRSTRPSNRPSGTRPRPGPANIIEFVDSQDPNVKSAIQRHTAYHSAAQRREARLQSLRRGNQLRYLDWGSRQGTESAQPMSPESSSSSLSSFSAFVKHQTDTIIGSPQTNPGNLLPTPDLSLSRQSSGESSIPSLKPVEESSLQFCRLYLCMQHSTWINAMAGSQIPIENVVEYKHHFWTDDSRHRQTSHKTTPILSPTRWL